MNTTETIYTGAISARREDADFLTGLGVTLGGYDEEEGEFLNCRVPESVLRDKLDEHWGRFVWSLEPEEPPAADDGSVRPDGRTVLLSKGDLIAALGLSPADDETISLCKIDPRLPRIYSEEHRSRRAADRKLSGDVALSRRRGWDVFYDGPPLRDE